VARELQQFDRRSIVEAIAEAICEILLATGMFKTGYAYAAARTGTRPTFNIWWLGFSESGPERTAARQPTLTTFRYVAEIRENLTKDAEVSQKRLARLVQASRQALIDNHRLGPLAGVLRTRVVSGSQDVDAEDDQPMLVAQLIIEVDYAGAWTAPE